LGRLSKRPQEELFDVVADPDCVKNLLLAKGNYDTKAGELRERLFAELRAQDDPRIKGKGAMFDEYPSVKKVPTAQKP